jgi:hypothetical protein
MKIDREKNRYFVEDVVAEIVARSQKPDFHVCHLCGAQYKVPRFFPLNHQEFSPSYFFTIQSDNKG